jgi:hypothetical protein
MDPATDTALRTLRDIAVPAPVSFLPQTWGWAVLAAILALIAAILLITGLRRYHRNAYRRAALQQLDAIARQADVTGHADTATAVAVVVKRTALSLWPRQAVAGLSGEEWIRFIAAHSTVPPGPELKQLLLTGEYRDARPSDGPALLDEARQWIGQHHV